MYCAEFCDLVYTISIIMSIHNSLTFLSEPLLLAS